MRVGEQHATLCQAVDVRCEDRPLITTQTIHPILHIVHGEEQYVWLGGLLLGASMTNREQNHDDKGIIWPQPLTPFDVVLIPINMHRSEKVREAAEALYGQLQTMGLEVLFDDRDARPGVKFADAELIGIPHRLVVSERGLDNGELEYRHRRDEEAQMMKRDAALELLTQSKIS